MTRYRTSEGTLFVTEEFAFYKLGRNRGGVDRHEWSGLPRAKLVDRLGYQFFSCAAFAKNQYSQIIAQNPRDHSVNRLHWRTAANQR